MVKIKVELPDSYLADVSDTFRGYKKLAERALAQVTDEEFFHSRGAEANSIGLLVKHIAGNQRSRWRDFLTKDGEKPDRNRDTEFEHFGESRGELMIAWKEGWRLLFQAVEGLKSEDLAKTVLIRGETHTVFQAINRQLTHYAYHVGQIVLLAKEMRAGEWAALSVPKNRSGEFNDFVAKRIERGIAKTNPLEGTEDFAEEVRGSGGSED